MKIRRSQMGSWAAQGLSEMTVAAMKMVASVRGGGVDHEDQLEVGNQEGGDVYGEQDHGVQGSVFGQDELVGFDREAE